MSMKKNEEISKVVILHGDTRRNCLFSVFILYNSGGEN